MYKLNKHRQLLLIIAISAFFSFLTACSTTPDVDEEDETLKWPAEQLYQESKSSLKIGDYETAISFLEKLESRFPFGRYAQQAQLEIAYAYYKFDEPESAIAAADRFIKLHPRNPSVDYAYYLKGLASFVTENNFLEDWMDKDPSQLDPGEARKSYEYFATLLKKFPDSKYAEDSRKRMGFLRNNLARHEVAVAKFYLRKGAYVAAANRAKYILENYAKTSSINDALQILRESYKKLNISDLAADTERVIKLNQNSTETNDEAQSKSLDMEDN